MERKRKAADIAEPPFKRVKFEHVAADIGRKAAHKIDDTPGNRWSLDSNASRLAEPAILAQISCHLKTLSIRTDHDVVEAIDIDELYENAAANVLATQPWSRGVKQLRLARFAEGSLSTLMVLPCLEVLSVAEVLTTSCKRDIWRTCPKLIRLGCRLANPAVKCAPVDFWSRMWDLAREHLGDAKDAGDMIRRRKIDLRDLFEGVQVRVEDRILKSATSSSFEVTMRKLYRTVMIHETDWLLVPAVLSAWRQLDSAAYDDLILSSVDTAVTPLLAPLRAQRVTFKSAVAPELVQRIVDCTVVRTIVMHTDDWKALDIDWPETDIVLSLPMSTPRADDWKASLVLVDITTGGGNQFRFRRGTRADETKQGAWPYYYYEGLLDHVGGELPEETARWIRRDLGVSRTGPLSTFLGTAFQTIKAHASDAEMRDPVDLVVHYMGSGYLFYYDWFERLEKPIDKATALRVIAEDHKIRAFVALFQHSTLSASLPVDVYLFEGQGKNEFDLADASTIPSTGHWLQRTRMTSTAWHPLAAREFAVTHGKYVATLVVHRVRSRAIRAIVAQALYFCVKELKQHPSWRECEVLVQPLTWLRVNHTEYDRRGCRLVFTDMYDERME